MKESRSSTAPDGRPGAGSYLGSGLLTRNTVLNLVGQTAPLLVALVAIPLLIPAIGTDRFGLLVIAWVILGYFSLLDMGLGRSLTQLVAERLGGGGSDEIPGLAGTGILLMLAVGLLAGTALYLLSPLLTGGILNVPPGLRGEALAAFRVLALAVPFVVVSAGLRGLLESVQRFGWVNAVRIPQGVLSYLAPLAVVPVSQSLAAMVWALLAVRLGVCGAYGALCLRAFPGLGSAARHGLTHARDLMRLGGWITVSNLVGPLIVYADRFLIGIVMTSAAVAYYATPFEVVSRLWVIPGAVAGVFFPAFATSFRTDRTRTAVLLEGASRTVLLIVFPLAFVLIAFAQEGLALWVGDEFAGPGAPVARWLTLGMLVNAVAQVPFAFVQGVGRPDLTAKLHLVEAPFYFGLLWVLLGTFGITGAAVAWTVRATVDGFFLLWISSRILPEGRERCVDIALWTGVGVAILAATVIPVGGPALRVLLLAGLFAVAAWGAWWRIVPRARSKRSGSDAPRPPSDADEETQVSDEPVLP